MTYTPEMNDGRSIFVFGSNLAGVHGKGAAKEAVDSWGALRGRGIGRQGWSYAIPTKLSWRERLDLEAVRAHVNVFIAYVKRRGEYRYLVTRIGCGLAGFTDEQIAPMFYPLAKCHSVLLPEEWRTFYHEQNRIP